MQIASWCAITMCAKDIGWSSCRLGVGASCRGAPAEGHDGRSWDDVRIRLRLVGNPDDAVLGADHRWGCLAPRLDPPARATRGERTGPRSETAPRYPERAIRSGRDHQGAVRSEIG